MKTEVKDQSLSFKAPMICAILDETKTQTRRLVKPQPPSREFMMGRSGTDIGMYQPKPDENLWRLTGAVGVAREKMGSDFPKSSAWKCPCGIVGDRIWVRETWKATGLFGGEKPSRTQACSRFVYAASKEFEKAGDTFFRWRPSIHMPRWASRITLEITEVRAERLNEISHSDVLAEGIREASAVQYGSYQDDTRENFQHLWESIYGPGSWKMNPMVWVIGFKRIEQ